MGDVVDAAASCPVDKGVAPVKREFLLEGRVGAADAGETRKKLPKSKPPSFASRLCPSLNGAATEPCAFGANACKFEHDVDAFWARRPPDIAPQCAVFGQRGYCPYGASCRFAGAHTTVSGGDAVAVAPVAPESAWAPSRNNLSAELTLQLRKRTYDFAQSDDICTRSTRPEETSENSVGAVVVADDGGATRASVLRGKRYLAPLTTVGNLPFRRVCVGLGAEVTCGEMALAAPLLQPTRSEWSLVKRHPSEALFGVQLCGGDSRLMTRAAQLLADQCQVDFVDVNIGCPIDLVCQKGGGCALMARSTRLAQILGNLSTVLRPRGIPLTLKMRAGIQFGHNLAHSLIPKIKDRGIDLITIHGRSKEQRYTKRADWAYVATCAETARPLDVFGCGDVLSFDDYYNGLDNYGLSGVMVGRGALIKPWVFTEIRDRRHWDISAGERLDMLKEFVAFGLDHWGSDQLGVDTTRRFLLEWLSFLHRYVPVGLLDVLPQRMNARPPPYFGRTELETLMASERASDWVEISRMLLGPTPDGFVFVPKHKANAY